MDENKSLADANLSDSNKQQETVKSDAKPAENAGSTEKAVQQTNSNANQSNTQNVDQKKPAETVVQSNPNSSRKEEKPKVKKRRFHLYHVKNAIKKAHPLNISTMFSMFLSTETLAFSLARLLQ